MRTAEINKDATVYHYQLIRKIPLRMETLISYAVIALLLGAFQLVFYKLDGAFSWVIGLVSILIVQRVILKLTMLRVDEPDDRKWGWRFQLPWFGFLPIYMVEHQLLRKLHRHLMWIGLCLIAVSYPWVSESLIISFISWHLWLLAPRLYALRLLRKQRRDGLIKLDSYEVLFYHR